MCKSYGEIVKAKSAISDALGDSLDSPEDFIDFVKSIVKSNIPFATKVAFVTVLTTGTVSEDDCRIFYMPSTKDCCDAAKHVRKAISKKRSLRINVHCYDYGEYTLPVWKEDSVCAR